jgi:hypothetical protein
MLFSKATSLTDENLTLFPLPDIESDFVKTKEIECPSLISLFKMLAENSGVPAKIMLKLIPFMSKNLI